MMKPTKDFLVKLGAAAAASVAVIGASTALHSSIASPLTVSTDPYAFEIKYLNVEAPQTASANGVVTEEEWAAIYPEIVASYNANENNTYRVSYLDADQDPYLANIYEGYGFAIDYTSAVGHSYCLEDVTNTQRPHALANCLTCKTGDFTKLVNDLGADAYSLPYEDVIGDMNSNVGCYTCHENQAGNAGALVVTHDYIIERMGDNMNAVNAATLSCGQCHIEYYFKPENKATSIPYTSVEEMTPEAILAYYDSIGFSDWTQESTGASLLKAQHPEMETYLNGSIHAGMGMSCADCHMPNVTSDTGVNYTSHELLSPLDSEELLFSCTKCHGDTDMAEKVHAIQEEITTREKEIGNDLADFNDALADAVASGKYSEDELNQIRGIYRTAQWFFDYDYVENSEGAHNSALANQCLDTAAENIAQGMALLNK